MVKEKGSKSDLDESVALYIHIPFCKQKCRYCAFLSYTNFSTGTLDEYVNRLIKELRLKLSQIEQERIKYVYIGGGTPNVLSIDQIKKIRRELPDKLEEFSIELNPGLADLDYLKQLKMLGINRISAGIQSFNDENLRRLGRIHTSVEAKEFIDNIERAGFQNFNLDFIIAQPQQKWAQVKDDLEIAVSFNPTHISAYLLSIDKGTIFYRQRDKIIPDLPKDEEIELIYFSTIRLLESYGYNQYEVSNYAKKGFECKYNLNTWENCEYVGIGLGSESHIDGLRFKNTSNLERYLAGDYKARYDKLEIDSISNFEIATILGLRLRDGFNYKVPLSKLGNKERSKFEDGIALLTQEGFLEITNEKLKIPRQRILLLDYIIGRLLI